MKKHSLYKAYLYKDTIKPHRHVKMNIPKEKNDILDEYIRTHDIITRDFMLELGIRRVENSLMHAERRNKAEILQLNYNTWQITK